MLAACGNDPANSGGSDTLLTATTLGEQIVHSAEQYLAAEPYATADLENGERQARTCRACHTFEHGGPNMVGPNLYRFFGKRAGSAEGFSYSSALSEAGFRWTPRALDGWLQQPAKFLPGNRMIYPGIASDVDRADLIAYLLKTVGSEPAAVQRATE